MLLLSLEIKSGGGQTTVFLHTHQVKNKIKKSTVKVEANEGEKKLLLIFQSHLEISKQSQDVIM